MSLARWNKTLQERFLDKIEKKSSGCWEWTAFRNAKGYGHFKIDGRHIMAHRVAYELFVGEIGDNLLCLHRCDNPPCVNPSHLFLGTNQDNMDDMKLKGRKQRGDESYRAKLTKAQVCHIRIYHKAGTSMAELARSYNVNPSCIYKIINNKTWVEA